MATYDKHAESGLNTASSSNGSQDRVEDITHAKLGYGEERDDQNRADVHDADNPNVYQHVCPTVVFVRQTCW